MNTPSIKQSKEMWAAVMIKKTSVTRFTNWLDWPQGNMKTEAMKRSIHIPKV